MTFPPAPLETTMPGDNPQHDELLAQADVLDRAADELLVRGWTQGALENTDGQLCALGAIYVADTGQPTAAIRLSSVGLDAFSAFADSLPGGWIATWNNDPDRTEDEVHDALRGCAKDLRERAGVSS